MVRRPLDEVDLNAIHDDLVVIRGAIFIIMFLVALIVGELWGVRL